MIKKYIISIVLFLAVLYSNAQQSQTMYFMDRLPQANLVNPAHQSNCKIRISGLVVPVAGQLLPAIHENYGNNGFVYKDFVQYDSATDSLSTLLNQKTFDFEPLLKSLRDINFITLESHFDIISFGMKLNNGWDITYNLADKIDYRFMFSKDIIQMIADGGNGDTFSGNSMQLGHLGTSFTYYREFAFGASKKIDNQWTVGAKVKVLFGQQNVWTKKSDITWYTDDNTYDYTFHADMEIRTSQSFYEINDLYYDYEEDTLIFDGDDLEPGVKDIALRWDNPGLAVDLGAEYILNDKITLTASLIDLGFIHWKNNVNTFTVNGDYYFDGYNIQPAMIDDSTADAEATEFKQNIIRIFFPDRQVDAYNSHLTPKFYLGGTYKFNNWLNAGLLYRGAVFQDQLHSAVTLSGNANINKWLSASLSYSVMYNSFANMGIGLVAKAGFAQFFVVTDNIWGEIFPHNTRNINMRMGINLIFGCKKDASATLVGKSDL